MTARLYVMPMDTVVDGDSTRRGPSYVAWSFDPDPSNNVAVDDWVLYDYGNHPWALVAVEAADANHALLAAKANVRQIPANLDTNVGAANRDTVRAYLEAMALPGTWVVNGTQWREVVRTVCGCFTVGQRYDALIPTDPTTGQPTEPTFGQRLDGNLNVQWQNIPQAVRDRVLAICAEFGYSTAGLTPTTTVRNILKNLADQWVGRTVQFGSIMTV